MYFTAAEGGLGIDKALAASLVGAYGGGVYLSTILGAWLADRLFGSERVLFGSAVMIMAGHVALALIPGIPGLIAGLVLVGVGSGGLKANATALVGSLYGEKDDRRDAGFSIFYMGINAGALIGPLVTGWLQESQGFHWGFAAAAVGMAVGLAIYAAGPQEAARGGPPGAATRCPPRERTKYGLIFVGIAAVIAVLLATGAVNAENLAMIDGLRRHRRVRAVLRPDLQQQEGRRHRARPGGRPSSRCTSPRPRSGPCSSSSSPSSPSTRRRSWTGTCSAGKCRPPGSSRSTRCSSSSSPASWPPCGPGWATGSPARR